MQLVGAIVHEVEQEEDTVEEILVDAFGLTFAGTAGLVTRGGMSRRWQQPIDYPSSAWIV